MQLLLGIAFALLLAAELAALVVVGWVVAMFPYVLWQRSRWMAGLAVVLLAAVVVGIWKAHHGGAPRSAQPPPAHPEISISHIPIIGLPGAIYMLQFLVWVLVTPAVGLLYAALLAGALLLLPVIFYLNRPAQGSASAVGASALLVMLSGLGITTVVSAQQLPVAGVFGLALIIGILGAPVLIWVHGRRRHVTIAPFAQREP